MIKRHKKQIWSCKIGEVDVSKLPPGAGLDGPMRDAVTAAYMMLFGEAPKFLFSGWNFELTVSERDFVERHEH